MKIIKLSLTVIAAGIAILASLERGAQAAASFDSLSFKPADDHGYYLVNQQSQTLGKWGWALGLTGEFSNDSLVLKNAAGARIQDIIDNQIALQLGAALGLTDWLNVGLNVSAVPWQQFTPIGSAVQSTGAHMGDIRLDAKARLLDNDKYPVGIAIVPFVTFPTGSDSRFVGNGKFTGGALAVLDSKRIADRVSLVKKKLEAIVDVTGWTTFNNFFKSDNRNLELNGGLRFFPTDKLAVTAGAGTGLLDGPGAPDYRAFVTLAYRHPREEEAAPPPVAVRGLCMWLRGVPSPRSAFCGSTD